MAGPAAAVVAGRCSAAARRPRRPRTAKQEQDGELCGPRPLRMETVDSDSGELMQLPTGMLTGGQLLALLKDFGGMMS